MTNGDAKRREERVKLIATGLANVGTASIVAGVVSPVFGGTLGPWTLVLALLFGLGFHGLAQAVVGFVVSNDDTQEAQR